MQKQKAGKRKIYVFAVGMILLFLIGKYSGWSGRLLNGDLTQALQHITVENLPAAIFIYLVVTAVGSVAFALPGICLVRCWGRSAVQLQLLWEQLQLFS